MSDKTESRDAYEQAIGALPQDSPMWDECEYRWCHDSHFRSAVDIVAALAMQHGFTPYELKQIAFMAAMKVESMASCAKWVVRI